MIPTGIETATFRLIAQCIKPALSYEQGNIRYKTNTLKNKHTVDGAKFRFSSISALWEKRRPYKKNMFTAVLNSIPILLLPGDKNGLMSPT